MASVLQVDYLGPESAVKHPYAHLELSIGVFLPLQFFFLHGGQQRFNTISEEAADWQGNKAPLANSIRSVQFSLPGLTWR